MVSKKLSSISFNGPVTAPSQRSSADDIESDAMVNLESVFAVLREQYPVSKQSGMQRFLAAFYDRMEADEFSTHTPQQWAALAMEMLEFARVRRIGTVNVRVCKPTVDANAWNSSHTMLQIVNDDMPFLVDTVIMTLTERGIGVHLLFHPVIALTRDHEDRLIAIGEGTSESLMVLEIDRQSTEQMTVIERAIHTALEQVRVVVADWRAMREHMVRLADDVATRCAPYAAQRDEIQAFLRWLAEDHFIFLAYREYRVEKQGQDTVLASLQDTALGLMRGVDVSPPRPIESYAAYGLSQSSGYHDPLILTKTNARSPVHRTGHMDYIGVLEFDAEGYIIGERRFLGLFTSSAYYCRPSEIPFVRQRYAYVMSRSGLTSDSHNGKALCHILETLPREELFQSDDEELYRTAMGILGLQDRVRSRLFLRRDKYKRFISALVFIPREHFNQHVRVRIEALLKDVLHGEYIDSSMIMSELSPLVQLHLIVRPKSGHVLELDSFALQERVTHVLRNGQDALREVLVTRHGEEAGLHMMALYGRALPAGYLEDSSIESAAVDVEHVAALHGPDDLRLSLHVLPGAGLPGLRLKLYRQIDGIPLSDVLPMMENLGLRVISERLYRLQIGVVPVCIQHFEVTSAVGAIDTATVGVHFVEAFVRIWNGNVENDRFNTLVLAAGLHWRQVALLRGYCKYLLQTSVPFSQSYVEATFAHDPLLARLLVELFEARFNPTIDDAATRWIDKQQPQRSVQLRGLTGGDEATLKALEPLLEVCFNSRGLYRDTVYDVLLKLMDRVSNLDEDRILRSFIGVIDATLR
ncbi:MAG TPA: NAD-glutamate dehydrogenase, partial [Xylella sp.]